MLLIYIYILVHFKQEFGWVRIEVGKALLK